VIYPLNCDPLDHLPPAPFDQLEHKFLSAARTDMQVPHLLKIFCGILISQSQSRRSVPLTDVVRMIKSVYVNRHVQSTDVGEMDLSFANVTTEDIAIMRERVEFIVKEKILVTYLTRAKIDRRQAQALAEAMRDILIVWSEGEKPDCSLLAYLQKYLPMDSKEYESNFRSKMEYLLKIARQEFANQLTDNI
jgi:hypothetical protein